MNKNKKMWVEVAEEHYRINRGIWTDDCREGFITALFKLGIDFKIDANDNLHIYGDIGSVSE